MFSLFKKTKKLKISDGSGFLAIVNDETYQSFVAENWELSQLMAHFISEMNKNSLIFWGTGSPEEWTVSLLDKPSGKKSFREFTKSITVTNEKLYMTNYEDLTMAAQFKDEKIPAAHNSDWIIKLDNGKYDMTIRQMFDPEDYDYEAEGKINFEIVMQKTNQESASITEIYWWTE